MPLRNAVTFSGKRSPVSARSRPIHSLSVDCTASNKVRTATSESREVSVVGDSRARCRISSE